MATKRGISDRELLEQFKEKYPEFGSTQKIAEMNEEQFALQYAGSFDDGSRQARRVHKTAGAIYERTALIWANIKDVVASPYYQGALFNNIEIPKSFIDYLQQIPAYNRLFGSLDFLECEHCRSIFGPAAYFVDLLRFVEQNIGSLSSDKNDPVNEIPEEHRLDVRRPDLPHIRLDCHNAYDLIPYIDLVNEVLEAIIRTEEMPDAYQVLEESVFPTNLPFNLPLAEIRSYLAQLKTSLHQIYQTFEQEPGDKKGPICREFLELSPREFSLVISEISNPTDVLKHYGDVALTGAGGLENVAVFLEQTGLTRPELNELVYQDLDRHEINAGLSRLFFVNNADDGLRHLTVEQDPEYPYDPGYDSETLLNLSYAKLDRIYRFLKLARKLGWSFVELDTALRSLQPAYTPEKVLQFDGLNDHVACRDVSGLDLDTFTIEAWVNPARLKANPIVGKGNEKGDDGTQETHFLFWIDCEGRLAYYDDCYEDAGDENYPRGFRLLPEGEFSHVAVTVVSADPQIADDETVIRFYVNGELDSEVTRNEPIEPLGADLNIGHDLDDVYFEGVIKDVRIWEGIRSQQSIAEYRYQRLAGQEDILPGGTPPGPTLAGYWPLVETRSNTLPDHSPNGNHGLMGGKQFVTQPTWVHRDLILDPMPELVERSSAYEFNGSDQYLTARDVDGLEAGDLEAGDLTIEAWIELHGEGESYIAGKELIFDSDSGEQRLTQLLLWVDSTGKLVFNDSNYSSDGSILEDELTHVCVTLTGSEVKFYIDGALDTTVQYVPVSWPDDPLLGNELVVGSSLTGENYFNGFMKEVRIWSTSRDAEQIAMHMHRPVPGAAPGLIAYWRLNDIEDVTVRDVPHNQDKEEGGPYEFTAKVARDLTGNGNDLYLGGVPGDYMPDQVVVATQLLAPPVVIEGTVLQFDGKNDVIAIQNRENTGLGKHERLTMEMWFRATDASLDRNQVIYSQGDQEAGLNAYLRAGSLYVIAWKAGYEGANSRKTVFRKDDILSDQWYHLAVVNDESQELDYVVFVAYLDGTALTLDPNAHPHADPEDDQRGYRLSPVGPAFLGGLGEQGITRFWDGYSVPDDNHQSYFIGQITDLRLWKKAKTPAQIGRGRYVAPSRDDPDPDLIAYLPMDEGEREAIQDQVPDELEAGYNGVLQARNIAFVNDGSNPELENCYSHYMPDGGFVLTWSDYTYRGRMYIASADSGIGVTFLSRYPEDTDQFYRLRRFKQRPAFHLAPHPHGLQAISGILDSGIDPTPGIWYHFLIEVEDTGAQTDIRAKIWPDGEPEPAGYQIDAFDDSPDRITSGTVGVWTFGSGGKRFDDLEVLGLPTGGATEPTRLLDESFESYSSQDDPDGWKDTSIRVHHDAEADVFRTVASQENRVYGTESELDDIHAHYYPPGGAIDFGDWEAYEYSGRMYMTEPDGGIGLTFFGRYPDSPLRYYRLGYRGDGGGFHLDKRLSSMGQPQESTSSSVEFEANTWYRFRIQVEYVHVPGPVSSYTAIRASVWEEGTDEPVEWQIGAIDSKKIFKYGTVGFWTKGSGAKYFDDLQVAALPLTNPPTILLDEDFASFADGTDPPNWVATEAGYGLDVVPGLFETSTFADIGFGTDLDVENVHSHYMPGGVEVLAWENYEYTGRMYVAGAESGVGVTFLSRYPEGRDQYYGLRRDAARPAFHLVAHPHGIQTLSGEGAGVEVPTSADTWYRFRIQVKDTGTRTEVQAMVWADGALEPASFQFVAHDDTDIRIRSGTVGVWATGAGAKYFDDLKVQSEAVVLRSEDFESYGVGERPDGWRDTAARDRFDEDPALFKTLDVQDNLARWATIEDYPLLLHPLDGNALEFDGQREYVGRDIAAMDLAEFTLEAWIKPEEHPDLPPEFSQRNPILTLLDSGGLVIADLRLNTKGHPRLEIEGQDGSFLAEELSIASDQWTHLAISAGGEKVAFYVCPRAGLVTSEEQDAQEPSSKTVSYIEIGRGRDDRYFRGRIAEVRLWSSARTLEQIAADRYQIPKPEDTDLVGYWPFIEFVENDGVTTKDASAQGNPLRMGGPEQARRPTLSPVEWTPSTQEVFWRPERKALEFNGIDDAVSVDGLDLQQRRTMEVWFAVEDKDISSRAQVIYKEGDIERGLVLYVHQGRLYYGGYDQSAGGSNWAGTWLSTDRITSGRWHHAALVLDGRPEVRVGSLQALLDGKVADVGPGSQLQSSLGDLTLGSGAEGVCCHDPAFSGNQDQYFQGQMLELRVWNTARTPAEIADSMYGTLTGDEAFLELWWQFDEIDGTEILDKSGHEHHALASRDDQPQAIGALPAYRIPPIPLDEEALRGIATIKRLKDESRWPMDKLSALWHSLKHTGREDQKVLYDQVFNTEGVVSEPWPYYIDQPVLWDITGEQDQSGDRRTRNRLMGALQVSHDGLNLLVASLSGPDETIIELDGNYLANLYRLAKMAGLLRLSVKECTRLMSQMGLAAVGSLEDLAQLVDRAEWMRRTGIDVYELDFLAHDIQSEAISFNYTEADIRDLADDLTRQSRDFLVNPYTLVSPEISEFESKAIFDYLTISAPVFIDDIGAVTSEYTELTDLAGLALARDWRQDFVALGGNIFEALKDGGSIAEDGIVDDNGLVLFEDLEDLDDGDLLDLIAEFEPGSEPSRDALVPIRRALESRRAIQDLVVNMLVGRRDDHASAVLAGVSGLVGVDPDRAQPILSYFRDHALVSEGNQLIAMGPSYSLKLMMGLQEDAPIPEAITDYLYKLSKILYLTGQFDLSTEEVLALIETPDLFGVEQILNPDLADLNHLYLFQELKIAFADTEGLLLNLLALDGQDEEATAEAIVELSGWERRQLDSLMAYFGTEEEDHWVTGLSRLRTGFDVAALLGVDIGFVIELAATDDLSLDFCRDQSAALLKVLRAQYSDEQWPKVYKPIHDPLAVLRSDALISKAMLQVSAEYEGRRDADILSQYVLIDVQTGSEVDTSRIVQAIASVQLYVQRCLMNLEKGVKPETIPVEQWEWMKNYRVWEANRKVFLYPENYIEPELRDTKTPLFEALELELMQDEVNQVAVERAYTNYLDGFAAVANLKIVGSYLHREEDDLEADEILYLVGRTDTQPRIYYYREWVNQRQWLPWKKIDLTINTDFVTPVYAFNRLYLFWPEIIKLKESEGTGEEAPTSDVYRPTIKYAYYNFSGTWAPPQTFLEVDKNLSAVESRKPKHQRVYAQRALRFVPDPPGSEAEEVTVLELDNLTLVQKEVPLRSHALTFSFWLNFENLAGLSVDALPAESVTLFDYLVPPEFHIHMLPEFELKAAASNNVSENPEYRRRVDAADSVREKTTEAVQDVQSIEHRTRAASGYLDIVRMADNETTEEEYQFWKDEYLSDAIGARMRLVSSGADREGALSEATEAGAAESAQACQDAIDAIQDAIDAAEAMYAEYPADLQAARDAVSNPLKPIAEGAESASRALDDAIWTAALALETETDNPRWESTGLALRFSWHTEDQSYWMDFNPDEFSKSVAMLYDQWTHLALTLDIEQNSAKLYVDGVLAGEDPNWLDALEDLDLWLFFQDHHLEFANGDLSVGSDLDSDPVEVTVYKTQMAEFRVWDHVRSQEEIEGGKGRRMTGREAGLFYLPLDTLEPGMIMHLVDTDQLVLEPPGAPEEAIEAEWSHIEEERERIIVLYGGRFETMRNNMQDQSFRLKQLESNDEASASYDLSLSLSDLHVVVTPGLSLNDFVHRGGEDGSQTLAVVKRFTPDTIQYYQGLLENQQLDWADRLALKEAIREYHEREEGFEKDNYLLKDLTKYETSLSDVNNQPGWYILDTGEAQYLVQACEPGDGAAPGHSLEPQTAAERLHLVYNELELPTDKTEIDLYFDDDPVLQAQPDEDGPGFAYKLTLLSTYAVHDLSLGLFRGGLDELLSLGSQQLKEPGFAPEAYKPELVILPPDSINFDNAHGIYYREIFFHIPLLIANQLNANQQFTEAQKWYHYVFNPMAQEEEDSPVSHDRYWRFLPFRGLSLESLADMLSDGDGLEAYHRDPFDPHAIARLRFNAYQKAVVMKYIDNLLDWGDYLFGQDTRESINEAVMLFLLAYDLLGPKPKAKVARQYKEIGDYHAIRQEQDPIPDFLAQLNLPVPDGGNGGAPTPHSHLVTDFCVVENAQFAGYWDRVLDRLFKIRHSMNIEGVFRQLALFEPPIDPMALVRAVAGGRDIGSLLSDVSQPVPHYRYAFMLEKAKEMISTVIDLGGAMQSALESRDAEQLAILENTHEKQILDLMTQVKEYERDEVVKAIEALRISKESVTRRKEFYQKLIEKDLSDEEIAELVLTGTAQGFKVTSTVLNQIAAALGLAVPQFYTGYVSLGPATLVSHGGQSAAESLSAAAEVFDVSGDILNIAAGVTGKMGGYKRRKNGWTLERDTANSDLQEIEKQIEMAGIRRDIAQREIAVHKKTIEHNGQIASFYRDKFSNRTLYNWMVSRLSSIYFQAYKLAYDLAKSAQRAVQYELPTNDTYISYGHWDNLKKGLLAGDSLMLEVRRMEKAHLEQDSRFQDIEKTISMAETMPLILLHLQSEGWTEFQLREGLFNQDFPGHYCRLIKSLSISIKTGENVPQEVHATLTQLGSKVLLEPDANAVGYLMGDESTDQPDPGVIRSNWRSNQAIAISRPVEDDGMFGDFNLNLLFDDRYFPFEGTGAVSDWMLEIPADNNTKLSTITDVVIHLKYTAKYDRGEFRSSVQQLMAQ